MRSFLTKTILFAVFIFLSACEDCVFVSKNSTLLVLTFTETDDQKKTIPSTLYFDSIKSSVGKRVYLLNSKAMPPTFIKLQVDPSAEISTFFFYSEGTKKTMDTLTVTYSRKISVVTPNCGFDEQIDLLDIQQATFKEKKGSAVAKNKILFSTLLIGDDANLRKNIEISR